LASLKVAPTGIPLMIADFNPPPGAPLIERPANEIALPSVLELDDQVTVSAGMPGMKPPELRLSTPADGPKALVISSWVISP
jgi:hypothetical protein